MVASGGWEGTTGSYKVLLYSTGNYIQYPVINLNGKEYEKEYITESFCCTAEMNTLSMHYISIKLEKTKP